MNMSQKNLLKSSASIQICSLKASRISQSSVLVPSLYSLFMQEFFSWMKDANVCSSSVKSLHATTVFVTPLSVV